MNNHRFELVIQVRDNQGNLTGKTKSFSSDYPAEIEDFWLKNNTQSNKNKHEQSKVRRNKSRKSNNETQGGNGEEQQTPNS